MASYNDRYLRMHPGFLALLLANPEKVVMRSLLENPAVARSAPTYKGTIGWWFMSSRAKFKLRTSDPDEIDWWGLSSFPAAIELLIANPDKIHWKKFGRTEFLEYDYKKIAEERGELNRELIESVFHSSRIEKWLDDGNDINNYMN